jgi:hypothetical protein
VELETQERGIVLQVDKSFLAIPQEFDINPKFPSWGKFTLSTTLCTWIPNLAHLLSVIMWMMTLLYNISSSSVVDMNK